MILTIFGYPKTGKTLLFNLLTDKKEELSKFSASVNEFHKAVVNVPDKRLKKLADFFSTPPVYAKIEYLDAGTVSFGDSKSSTFIDLIRRADGLVHMVRGFEDEEILHPKGSINPVRDIRSMEEELITTDFLTVEKRIERIESDLKKIKHKELVEELVLLKKINSHLEGGEPLRTMNLTESELLSIKGFKFLSLKPVMNIINCDENSYRKNILLESPPVDNSATFIFAGKIEMELLELEEDERPVFEEEYDLQDYSYMRESFITHSYDLMNLISFFTVGSDETKAWTIDKGDNAFEASGKIHSDIQQGFIRGETINWEDFLNSGGFPQAKEKGLLRLEGKEYVIRDGDIIHFRFNK